MPETTLNINSFFNSNGGGDDDYGVVLGVNIPLGGKSRKSVQTALDTQVKADVLAFERTYASVCANLESEFYEVANGSGNVNLLKNCKSDLVSRKLPTPPPSILTPPTTTPPVVDSNAAAIEELRKENAELKLLLAQLVEKLDKGTTTVPGGY